MASRNNDHTPQGALEFTREGVGVSEDGPSDAGPPVENESVSYDRHAAMFPEGAPDVGIAWINVHRQTLTELAPGEIADFEDADEDGVHWQVYGWPNPAGTESTSTFVVFGDLTVSHGQWFLGVTAAMGLTFRDRTLPIDPTDVEDVNRMSRALGGWASSPLYDVASMVGRQLVGGNFLCKLQLPQLTPEAHFADVLPFTGEDETIETHTLG